MKKDDEERNPAEAWGCAMVFIVLIICVTVYNIVKLVHEGGCG